MGSDFLLIDSSQTGANSKEWSADSAGVGLDGSRSSAFFAPRLPRRERAIQEKMVYEDKKGSESSKQVIMSGERYERGMVNGWGSGKVHRSERSMDTLPNVRSHGSKCVTMVTNLPTLGVNYANLDPAQVVWTPIDPGGANEVFKSLYTRRLIHI